MRHLKTVHASADHTLRVRLEQRNGRGFWPRVLTPDRWDVHGFGPREGVMRWHARDLQDGTEYLVFERIAPGGAGAVQDWFAVADPEADHWELYAAWRAASGIRELNAAVSPSERITSASLLADLERDGPGLWPSTREALALAAEYLRAPPS